MVSAFFHHMMKKSLAERGVERGVRERGERGVRGVERGVERGVRGGLLEPIVDDDGSAFVFFFFFLSLSLSFSLFLTLACANKVLRVADLSITLKGILVRAQMATVRSCENAGVTADPSLVW